MGKVLSLIPPRPPVSKGGGNNAGLYCLISAYKTGENAAGGATYALKMPKEVSDNFSADWQQEELSADFLNRLLNNSVGGTAGVGNTGVDFMSELGEQLGLGGFAAKRMFNAGVAKNKEVALLYRNPNLKQYQLSWDFIPVSSKDASGVKEFLDDMRFYMHPSNDGQLYSYPYFFDVKMFAVGKIIFASERAALTNLTINPFGSGLPSFHADGNPVHTSVTLEFQEVLPKSANDIKSLYGGGG